MPRALPNDLDVLQTASLERRPAFRVEIYDLRSTSSDPTPTRIGDVVRARVLDPPPTLPAIVGPRDFTDDVEQYVLSEAAGDYVDSGVAAAGLELQIADPSGDLDPLESPAPADGRWLRQGNVVVVFEGDAQVDPATWPAVFTGRLVGHAGVDRNRTTGRSMITVSAVGREAQFLRQSSTSINFPQGTPYADMIRSLATADMGLSEDELAFPQTFATTLTCHRSTQFVEESPLVSIAKILFVDGQLPRFDGDGRLGLIDGQVGKSPARIYAGDELVRSVVRPMAREEGVNKVVVLGLSCDMSEIVQPRQVLARASITTGFFSQDAEIPVQWSEDGTLQAKNTRLRVRSSVGDGLLNFGSESYDEATQADGNALGGTIEVQGAIVQGLALLSSLLATWILLENTPEPINSATQQIQRPNFVSISRGVVQQAIVQTLATQGRGQYEVTGEPVEYVFEELRGIARVKDTPTADEREVELENALLNTQAAVDAAALRVLQRERKKQNVRTLELIHDLKLEPDDIVQTADGRRYMIRSLSRTIRRQAPMIAQLEAFEVTAGARP